MSLHTINTSSSESESEVKMVPTHIKFDLEDKPGELVMALKDLEKVYKKSYLLML